MKFARIIFGLAGTWGVVVLVPLYFAADTIGRSYPPQITHREYYFGFLGVALVWQFAFLVIAGNPARFRPMMPVAMAEKFLHVLAMTVLWFQGRMNGRQLAFNLPDLVLGILFVIAFVKTARRRSGE